MSVHGDVHAALKARLETWTGHPELARENRAFATVVGVTYLREKFIPQDSSLGTIGPNGRIRHSGMWLLDVFAAPLVGVTEADGLVGALLDLFPPALVLSYNGRSITIEKTFRSGGQPSAEWYQVPVSIAWYTDTMNTI